MDAPVNPDNHLVANCDMPFFDSGTDSQGSEESESSTVCDIGDFIPSSQDKVPNILDKKISVDEEILMVPLSPIKCTPPVVDEKQPSSILRPSSCFETNRESTTDSDAVFRRVSFPTDETELACYKESESQYPWIISQELTPEEIVKEYQSSCMRHKTVELDNLTNQLHEIKNNTNHSATLNLTTINVTSEVCETLEDLFKVANFRKIILNDCKFTLDTISEFLNMIEYYECVTELELAIDFEDLDVWKLFCNVTAKSVFLQSISFNSMNINEQHMRYFLNAVKYNPNVTMLRFDCCALDKLPSFYLIESLMYTNTIRELYLSQTGLYTKEADCLGRFLSKNFHLKILDISNNYIGDRGLESLAKGLTKQNVEGLGLSVLIVFNNQLTEKSGPIIASIIAECKNLQTLNIGFNSLTDFVVESIQSSLGLTKSLEGLGLQSTILTCKGVNALSEAIQENNSLKKINLKGNKAIQLAGLESLCNALTNSRIIKIEIDETNRSCNDPQKYAEMVKKITAICTVNKQTLEEDSDASKVSRKVSLSCEPSYLPPPVSVETCLGGRRIVQPLCGVPNRFQVIKVQDVPSPPKASRFKVCKVVATERSVLPSPSEEEENGGKFLNVRSSLSSNDSLESLPRDEESP